MVLGLHRHESKRITHGLFAVHNRLVHAINVDSVAESLWNQAYDQVSREKSHLVAGYEEILCDNFLIRNQAQQGGTAITIAHEHNARRHQMQQLVHQGIQKAHTAHMLTEGLDNFFQVTQFLKGVLDSAVQASPQAALAWAGISVILEVLQNPRKEMQSNREGIVYIAKRMEWYWDLANLVLSNGDKGPEQHLRRKLERNITDLYAAILHYQMMSVCSYYRSRKREFFRSLVKRDDWEGTLQQIKDMEESFEKDLQQFNAQRTQHLLLSVIASNTPGNARVQPTTVSGAVTEAPKVAISVAAPAASCQVHAQLEERAEKEARQGCHHVLDDLAGLYKKACHHWEVKPEHSDKMDCQVHVSHAACLA